VGNKKRSVEYLIDSQEGTDELLDFQVENKKRSVEDLIDFQEGRSEISYLQEGNEKRSVKDLADFQEGRTTISSCQVGKEEEMILFESLGSSEVISDQQRVLTEEDHRCILIIGGIKIFLPSNPVEASACVEGVEEERQPTNIVMEEKEKTLTSAQTMKGKEEHSEKMLT
jgi:hypothetical protein